jgi:hypothetical protein
LKPQKNSVAEWKIDGRGGEFWGFRDLSEGGK